MPLGINYAQGCHPGPDLARGSTVPVGGLVESVSGFTGLNESARRIVQAALDTALSEESSPNSSQRKQVTVKRIGDHTLAFSPPVSPKIAHLIGDALLDGGLGVSMASTPPRRLAAALG